MRFSLLEPEFGWGERDEPGSQTERERALDPDVDEEELGQSESVDDDDVGDIADEGTGRRG